MHRSLFRSCGLLFGLTVLGLAQAGCQTAPGVEAVAGTETDVSLGAVSLCSGCGQIKGSAMCCQPGQPLCAKCGLVKGSPGCCKIPKAGQSKE